MIAAELIALLGFELDVETLRKVEEFFKGGEEKLKSFGEKAAQFLGKGFAAFFAGDLYEAAKSVATSMLSYLNPATLAQSAREYANIADAIGKGAVAIGITTEEYQELQFVGQQAGIGFEEIAKSISKITMGVGEAARGSTEWQKIFKDIGVSYKDMSTMSPSDRFDAIVNGLSNVGDATKRAALAQKIFEDQAPKFTALLAGGVDGVNALRQKAQELGNIIPEKDIDNAGKLNERLDFMNARFDAIKNRVYGALLPAVEALVSAMLNFLEANEPALNAFADVLGAIASAGFGALTRAARFASQVVATLTGRIKTITDNFGDMNAAMRLAAILAVAFGLAWTWTTRAQLQIFLSALLVQLKAVGVSLIVNTISAVAFLKSLTAASVWNAVMGMFTKLAVILTGTTAQFILIAGAVFFLLIALEDLYTFFDGGDSVIGDTFSLATFDVVDFTDGLLGVGLALGFILLMFSPILALVLILALMVAYLAANWELVGQVFQYLYDELVDGLSDLMLYTYDGFMSVAGSIKDFFMGIVETVSNAFELLFDNLLSIPEKARSILNKIPGVNLSMGGAGIAQAMSGPGAFGPGVDAQNAAARAAANRSVTIAPTINLQVDAKDRSSADAQTLVKGAIEDELWRNLGTAYDGDED